MGVDDATMAELSRSPLICKALIKNKTIEQCFASNKVATMKALVTKGCAVPINDEVRVNVGDVYREGATKSWDNYCAAVQKYIEDRVDADWSGLPCRKCAAHVTDKHLAILPCWPAPPYPAKSEPKNIPITMEPYENYGNDESVIVGFAGSLTCQDFKENAASYHAQCTGMIKVRGFVFDNVLLRELEGQVSSKTVEKALEYMKEKKKD